MKKILLSVIAVLSMLFILAACGEKPGDNPVTPPNNENPITGGDNLKH
ncbi:MAG: hypothetical protein IJD23_09130 [Spirochaetaceae bacterium]|nr:hypothetical protein [Spirochaetaceae bacterium]